MPSRKQQILFLDKLLLNSKECSGGRGVHQFNKNLLEDLESQGVSVLVPCTGRWKEVLGTGTALVVPEKGGTVLKALVGALKSLRYRYSSVLLANSTSGLVPAAVLVKLLKPGVRVTVLAHKMASTFFKKAIALTDPVIVSVNGLIESDFREAGIRNVTTYYGVSRWERFVPAENTKDAKVNFCVLGDLDNKWKGADTAVKAFKRIPTELLSNVTLHLAAFNNPPPEYLSLPFVRVHPWINAKDIPSFINQMDVMIVPSRDLDIMKETFSQVMVQGMLCGLPIISSSLPVLAEKIPDGRGGLIFNSIDELASYVMLLAKDSRIRKELGEQARNTALQNYCWKSDYFTNKYLIK